jgi:hypothetical protein
MMQNRKGCQKCNCLIISGKIWAAAKFCSRFGSGFLKMRNFFQARRLFVSCILRRAQVKCFLTRNDLIFLVKDGFFFVLGEALLHESSISGKILSLF